MAIDPATMMMIAKGVGNMAQSGSRLLQPRFQNTKYGQMLRERSRNGNLSQAQESNILNKVGTQAGNNAQVARNKYIGSAINQGMGNSVALQRGLRESEADVRRAVTDTSRGIYQNEETAKSNAKMNYARAMDQDSSERRGALTSMITGGANTALQAGATEYGARQGQQQAQDKSYMDAMSKYGNAVAYSTPSGDTRYQGGGFDPSTGEARGSLTLDDKRSIDVYAQKAGIKNATALASAYAGYRTGKIDDTEMRKQLKQFMTDEEIDDFYLKMGGGK